MSDDFTNMTLWGPANGTETLQSPNFKDKQFQTTFVILNAIFRLAIGLAEMASNGFILYISWKYSSQLKTSCNHLLAMNALCDFLVASSTIITAVLTPFGTFQLTFGTCFWLNAVPQVAFNMSFVLIFFIALDRLIAVTFPLRHHNLNVKKYVTVLTMLSLLMALILFYNAIQTWNGNGQLMLRCTMGDFWEKQYQKLLQIFSLAFTLSAILCYAIIWLRLKFGKMVNQDISHDILKSLVILVAIILFCWVFGMALRFVIPQFVPKPLPLCFVLMNFTDWLLTFNGAANAVVLYCCRYFDVFVN